MTNNKICVIGLGYVGLPLAHAFSLKYNVVGLDIHQTRIDELNKTYDRTLELTESQLQEAMDNNIKFTCDINDIKDCNIYIVTVPTPIDKNKKPDLLPLIKASRIIGKVLKKDDIVIYESTVYPGVTEDICALELEKISGLKFNDDFYCGYSPERINPGDKEHTITKILKVTSASTPEIAIVVDELYKSIIVAGTYKASSIKVAEASKVIENTQRDVNIALINEFALIFHQMGIDTNEVIEAASTKWNFIKLTPGLVGGHCIGVDPYYLTYKAEELGYKPNLILASRQINNGMGKYIATRVIKEMINADKNIKNANVLILGLTFKEDCPDTRNTKVIDIVDEFVDFGLIVDIYDPWIDETINKSTHNYNIIDNPFSKDKKYDSIVVAVGHTQFKSYTESDYIKISNNKKIVIDVKNIVKNPTWRL
jgi:UDP-N-acetyl-D-galactosamine dehydrogenase